MIPIDPARYKDHPELLKSQRIQSDFMEREIDPIRNIYFDLMCLKDIQLGTLLSFIVEENRQDLYQHILDRLDEYNARMDREILPYFPALPYTKEMIHDRLNDPAYTDKIFTLSPTTACYENLHRILAQIKKHNNHVDKQLPLRVVINIYPFHITPYIKDIYTRVIKGLSPIFRVAFMEKPLKHVSPTTLVDIETSKIHFKFMFVWDVFDNFLGDDSKLKTMFTNDLLLQNMKIYSPKKAQVPLAELDTDTDELLDSFNLLYRYLNLCSEFEYMEFPISTTPPDEASSPIRES